MIYFIGGAPRTGKTILGQRISADLRSGWISTDLLWQVLQTKKVEGTNIEWDASPAAIAATAEWFFPCLERFVWGINSQAENYVIEGVAFLPDQIAQLLANYPIRTVFLGCSKMTLERFDRFPGRSPGYSFLPEEVRRQFAQDIPTWSEFIRQETGRFAYPYVDMGDDFQSGLDKAASLLTSGELHSLST